MKFNEYDTKEVIHAIDLHRIVTTDVLLKVRYFYAQRNFFRLVCYLNTIYESEKLEELSRQYFTTAKPVFLTEILNYMQLTSKVSDL